MNLKIWKIGMLLAIYGILLTGVAIAEKLKADIGHKIVFIKENSKITIEKA